jgi:hypothetical protein
MENKVKKILGLLVLVTISTFSYAEVVINGPKTVKEHSLIELEAKGITKEAKVTWAVDNSLASVKRLGNSIVFTGPPGTYKVTLFGADFESKEVFLIYHEVTIEGKLPPIPPVPPVPPDPTPNPVTGKCYVVIIEETEQAAKDRNKYLNDKALLDYVKSKNWKFEIVDKDVVDKNGKTPSDLKPYIDRAKNKDLPYVYVVTDKGQVRYENRLPKTPSELLTELKKVGG